MNIQSPSKALIVSGVVAVAALGAGIAALGFPFPWPDLGDDYPTPPLPPLAQVVADCPDCQDLADRLNQIAQEMQQVRDRALGLQHAIQVWQNILATLEQDMKTTEANINFLRSHLGASAHDNEDFQEYLREEKERLAMLETAAKDHEDFDPEGDEELPDMSQYGSVTRLDQDDRFRGLAATQAQIDSLEQLYKLQKQLYDATKQKADADIAAWRKEIQDLTDRGNDLLIEFNDLYPQFEECQDSCEEYHLAAPPVLCDPTGTRDDLPACPQDGE